MKYHACAGEGGRRLGVWEVGAVEGLGVEGHPEQQAVYHVTDTAALAGGAVARHARDAIVAIKAARRGETVAEARAWRVVESCDCALSLDAEVYVG